ncbi:MAG: fibronectin type III-like domain-contianing protein [Butyrivibrio sp.]|nr:fibronectin type III-like domain-contianing protein [Butyrivibrio sp.]
MTASDLAGFETVCLAPGETREVSFEITEQMLRFWTAGERWASESGVFTLWIGPDSTTEDGVTFTLD